MSGPDAWLRFAQDDLEVAESLMENHGPWNMVCFHAQQGVEKSLKAFLRLKEGKTPRLHSLVKLLKLCTRHERGLSRLRRQCEVLDRYYIPTRYPDAMAGSLPEGLPTGADAAQALGILRRIFKLMGRRVA